MTPQQKDGVDTGPPFWSIGIAVVLMLIVPIVLYSMAPAGPIREGDTIFSATTVKVPLAHPFLQAFANFDGTCLLDPHDPLMVSRPPMGGTNEIIFAKVQGKTAIEWPFCPPHSEIQLTRGHILQKADLWSHARQTIREWWR